MSTIEGEPQFLADVVADSAQIPKRRAVRIYHRGRLHRDPSVDPQALKDAEATLTSAEKNKARGVHGKSGKHELGTDPGPRQHAAHEPRNPWKHRR